MQKRRQICVFVVLPECSGTGADKVKNNMENKEHNAVVRLHEIWMDFDNVGLYEIFCILMNSFIYLLAPL